MDLDDGPGKGSQDLSNSLRLPLKIWNKQEQFL